MIEQLVQQNGISQSQDEELEVQNSETDAAQVSYNSVREKIKISPLFNPNNNYKNNIFTKWVIVRESLLCAKQCEIKMILLLERGL